MIEKSNSKWISLATVSILGKPPSAKTCLNALTAAALALPGVNHKASAGSPVFTLTPQAGFEFAHYEESGNRMAVDIYHGALSATLTDRLELSATYDFDTYVGATPAYSLPESMVDIVSRGGNILARPEAQAMLKDLINTKGFSSREAVETTIDAIANKAIPLGERVIELFTPHPREDRNSFNIGASYNFDDVTISLSGGNSDEPDYVSDFGSVNLSWETNQKLTTFNAGFAYATNIIGSTNDQTIEEKKIDRIFQFGFSQVLSKNALVQGNLTYTNSSGFQSNVYKMVYVRGETPSDTLRETFLLDVYFENRPKKRHQWALTGRFLLHFPDLNGSFHSDYRFFTDSWGIDSHTFELAWYQSLGEGWLITPSVRYYSQSEADFFAPFFLVSRPHQEYSSDFRLGAFGSLSGGIQLSKAFFEGKLTLNANFEYSTHQNDLKISGGADRSYADIDFYLVTTGILLKF